MRKSFSGVAVRGESSVVGEGGESGEDGKG